MKRFFKWFGLVTFGALLPLLMAPTGGIPSILSLQKLLVNTTTGKVCPSTRNTATTCLANTTPGHTAWALAVEPNGSAGNELGLLIDCTNGNSTDTCLRVVGSTGTQIYNLNADGTSTYLSQVFVPHCVYKHGTESRFSNTTLTADTNLTLTLTQNGYYKHTMWIELGAGGAGAGGFKWSFTGTAATSGRGESGVKNGVAFSNPEVSVLATVGTPITTLATATNDWIKTEGVMHITSAPQTVALQWAQNSSSSDTTSVLGDSYMCIDRIE